LATLCAELRRRHGIPAKHARIILLSALYLTMNAAAQGERVHIPGIGVFTRRRRKARHIANPQTSEPMRLPAQASVGFKAARVWRELPPKPRKQSHPSTHGTPTPHGANPNHQA
jgi:DNA-binding protein HU-beta